MKAELFQERMKSIKEAGFQILFETSDKNISFKTYMADEQGNTAVIQAVVKENGDVDFQQVIIPIRVLKRFCDESIKVYDDALTKRLHINK
jgi:hypothetical protein